MSITTYDEVRGRHAEHCTELHHPRPLIPNITQKQLDEIVFLQRGPDGLIWEHFRASGFPPPHLGRLVPLALDLSWPSAILQQSAAELRSLGGVDKPLSPLAFRTEATGMEQRKKAPGRQPNRAPRCLTQQLRMQGPLLRVQAITSDDTTVLLVPGLVRKALGELKPLARNDPTATSLLGASQERDVIFRGRSPSCHCRVLGLSRLGCSASAQIAQGQSMA
ncbi:hypothetical protein CCMA1212_002636 [Trichoderma ghanense]|uniref:Uncharacterized protein n=1 Tax=Trichoderma ghanense TaxID=65468 RepID=A0ABY2H9Z1_9HYPO